MKQDDKVALVTGASRGIGRAIAHELARLGYTVGIVSRSEDEITTAADEIGALVPGARIVPGAFDVADADMISKFTKKLVSQFGRISVLVNNAGEYTGGTSKVSLLDAQRMIEVNYLAAVRFVQEVAPAMKEAQQGYIFNVASVCGLVGFADVGAYCASKFALVGYSESLARELEPFGVRVTALCPSWVNTRMASQSPISAAQMIQPQDLAQAVRFVLALSPGARVRQIVLDCE